MARFDEHIGVRRDEMGAAIADAEARLGLTGAEALTGAQAAGDLNVDPSFTPLYDRTDPLGPYVTLAYFIPNDSVDLKIVFIEDALATTADDYDRNRKKKGLENDIEDAARTAGRVVDRLDVRLKYNTLYRIIKLISINEEGGRRTNPDSGETDFAGYPGNALYSFTTPDPSNAPSAPSSTLIKKNQLDPKSAKHDAFIELWVWAPLNILTGAAQTWAASGVQELVVRIDRTDFSPVLTDKKVLTITSEDTLTDPASTPVANRGVMKIVFEGLKVGAPYQWVSNTVWFATGDKVIATAASPVTFTGGNLGTNPATLTGVSLTINDQEPFDGKHRKATLNLTQPATPVAMRHVTIRVKRQGFPDTDYSTQIKKFDLQDDEYHTAGAKTIELDPTLKLKATKAYTVQIQITAIGGQQLILTQNFGTSTEPDVPSDTAVPGTLGVPVARWHKGLNVSNMTVGSQWNQGLTKYISISPNNGGGGPWFDINAYTNSQASTIQNAVSETAGRWRIGPGKEERTLDILLAALKTLYGESATVFVRFTAENLIGSTISSFSNGVPLATAKANENRQEAVNSVDAAILGRSDNFFDNSDFLGLTGADLNKWSQWDGVTVPIVTAGTVINTGSSNLRLLSASNSVVFLTQNRALIYNLKKGHIKRGGQYSFGLKARADTALSGLAFLIRICANDTGTVNTVGGGAFFGCEISLTGLDTSWREFGVDIPISSGARTDDGVNPVNQVFVLSLSGTLGAHQVEVDHLKMDRFKVPTVWTPTTADEGVMDYITTAPDATVDQVNPVGTGGGWIVSGAGLGGPIIRTTQ